MIAARAFEFKRATLVRELFAELGVLKPDGTWDERYLCFAPQERLFLYGRWQEGIEPAVGLSATDRERIKSGNALQLLGMAT